VDHLGQTQTARNLRATCYAPHMFASSLGSPYRTMLLGAAEMVTSKNRHRNVVVGGTWWWAEHGGGRWDKTVLGSKLTYSRQGILPATIVSQQLSGGP
jgi:hypothetical protein